MILFLLKILSRLLNALPRRAALGLGDAVGLLWFDVIRVRRAVALENLALAFPEKSPEERVSIARRNFVHYGRNLIEILRTITWTPDDYRRNVTLHGLEENVLPALRAGAGGIFLTSHLGNWEIAIAGGAVSGIPIDVVVKRARNRHVEAFLLWYRKKCGAGVLAEEGTAKDILRSLSRGRFPVFVFDQFMGPPIGLPVTFFGKRAGTAVALSLITEKKKVPVIPAYSYRDEKGHHHTVFEAPLELGALSEDKNERLFEKTQRYNDVLESHVRKHPAQWLWIHRRWKAYRGEPRWTLSRRAVAAGLTVLMAVLAGCASSGPATTGIALPPDPTIEVPKVKQVESKDPQEDGLVTVEPDVKPEPAPTPPPSPAKKKKKKREPVTQSEPKAAPAPVAKPVDVLEVVNADKIPFEIGEHMEIELTWMGLSAGTVVMEVREGEVFSGRPTFKLWGNVTSSRLVDSIYHVDNTLETYVDRAGLIPYKFLLHMIESAQTKETRVSFDHVNHKAHYWAKRISKRWGDENPNRTDDIMPLSKDMYSAVYYARALSYTLNKKITFPVYENGQNFNVEMIPVANELVRNKAGIFQCWKIWLSVKINNVLKPAGDLYLWLSDDSKRYIVKFDAKLKLGSLYGNLISVRERAK